MGKKGVAKEAWDIGRSLGRQVQGLGTVTHSFPRLQIPQGINGGRESHTLDEF